MSAADIARVLDAYEASGQPRPPMLAQRLRERAVELSMQEAQ